MRRGYAEERQDAVAQYLATDLRNVTDELGSLLGIHGLGEAGRANDICEQRRYWPAFTSRST